MRLEKKINIKGKIDQLDQLDLYNGIPQRPIYKESLGCIFYSTYRNKNALVVVEKSDREVLS